MTTITPTEPRTAAHSPASSLTFGGILRSEWIKLRTLRSTVWSYLFVVVIMLGLALMLSLTIANGGFNAPDAPGGSAAVYAGHDVSASLTDPDVFMPLLGASLYLALLAVFSLAVGTMVRSSAGGIGIVLALILVVPTVLQLIPADWAQDIHPYLLSTAGTNMFAPTEVTGAETLTAWQDLLVVLGWVGASTAGAATLLAKRDA